jgi:hypothetical protein
VRSHTTAQRVGGAFTIIGPQLRVREVLQLSRLESVFHILETLEDARGRRWHLSTVRLVLFGAALCVGLWWLGTQLSLPADGSASGSQLLPFSRDAAGSAVSIALELTKLVAAGLIGLLVTAVQRRFHDKPMTQAMEHAQVLLCVSGALVMMIIGDSLARAFGIAGAASIIRFRTPIEDPKDITILFLLMALGMATGMGSFGIAGAGTAFVCIFLFVLEHVGGGQRRTMMVEVATDGREFPQAHVDGVFARHRIIFELREVVQGKHAAMIYHATLDRAVSLEDVSADLMAGDAGVTAVAWGPPKRQ